MEKFFISHQKEHFDFDVVIYKVIFPICTLTWHVNNYVSRQGKGINRRIESTDLEFLHSLCSTDDNNQYYYFHH